MNIQEKQFLDLVYLKCISELLYLFGYKTGFFFSNLEWLQKTKSALWNFAIIRVLSFLNNLKDLDPSYKTDLDFWDGFEGTNSVL